MKKTYYFLLIMTFTLISLNLSAGAVDNNSNYSAEYARTLNRNAATDSTDAVFYNPAGLSLLENGVYVGMGNQFVIKKYTHSANLGGNEVSYSDENPILLFPNIQMAYRNDKWTGYLGFYVPAGGGTLKYDDGTILNQVIASQLAATNPEAAQMFASSKSEGSSTYYAFTAGGAYRISEHVSVSAGLRFILAKTTSKITAANGITLIDYEGSASGFGGVFGVDITPVKDLVIAARYESNTQLRWEADKSEGDATIRGILGYADEGTKYYRDLPPMLALGVSYRFIPEFKTDINYTLYFNEMANWDTKQDQHYIGQEVGIAFEYQPLKILKISTGFQYTNPGADKNSYYFLKPALQSVSFGGGFAVEPIEDLVINTGFMYAKYIDDSTNLSDTLKLDLEKQNMIATIGLQYKF